MISKKDMLEKIAEQVSNLQRAMFEIRNDTDSDSARHRLEQAIALINGYFGTNYETDWHNLRERYDPETRQPYRKE